MRDRERSSCPISDKGKKIQSISRLLLLLDRGISNKQFEERDAAAQLD